MNTKNHFNNLPSMKCFLNKTHMVFDNLKGFICLKKANTLTMKSDLLQRAYQTKPTQPIIRDHISLNLSVFSPFSDTDACSEQFSFPQSAEVQLS